MTRLCLPTFAELVDELTINRIKQVLAPLSEGSNDYIDRVEKLLHDIDLLIEEKQVKLTADLVYAFIILAQVNLHIWNNKDAMTTDPDSYDSHLKRAHQLNGIRNQIKNLLLKATGDLDGATRKTNFQIDGLQGWELIVKQD